MRTVRFTGRARAQLRAVARYLYRQTGDDRTGERFVRGLEERMLKLARLPGTLGRARPDIGDDIRSLPHHAYVIIFRYGNDTLDVAQVIHSRRDRPAAPGE